MSKVREVLINSSSGEVDVEREDGSVNSFNIGDVLTVSTSSSGGVDNRQVLVTRHGTADVLIYGATAAGFAAAYRAAKNGVSVVIVNPTSQLGGMPAGGLANCDIAYSNVTKGVFGEFARRIYELAADEYGMSWNKLWNLSLNVEPRVFRKAMLRLAAEYGIVVINDVQIVSASAPVGAARVVIQTTAGAMSPKIAIEATYEGDLLAAAGLSVRVGREASTEYAESLAGVQATGTAAQFADGVDPYRISGSVSSGLLPGVYDGPLATAGSGDGKVQAVTYRLAVTTAAGNKVAFPEPANYDPLNYELLGRHAAIAGTGWTDITTTLLTLYSSAANPVAKFDLNNRGPLSTNYIGPECLEYLTATPARRAEIRELVKQHILGFFKFIKTDSRIPASVRAQAATYGLCKDEFQEFGGWSDALYVRDGRRLVGDFVLSQADVMSAPNAHTDAVSWVLYSLDSHHCQRIVVGGKVKNEGYVAATPNYGNVIPLRVVLPKRAETGRVLSATCPSVSRVAWLSVRMEPNLMSFGEACGAVAAIAARTGVAVQDVPYAEVVRLMDPYGVTAGKGSLLSADGTTFPGGTVTVTGTWSSGTKPDEPCAYKVSSAAGASLKFAPNISEPGYYTVWMRYRSDSNNTRSSATPLTIVHADGTTTRTISQLYSDNASPGGGWVNLGRYWFAAGTPSAHYCQVGTDGSGSTGSIVTAVKFVP